MIKVGNVYYTDANGWMSVDGAVLVESGRK